MNQRSWPEKLKEDIAFWIEKYNVARAKGGNSSDEEEVWDWSTTKQSFIKVEMSDGTADYVVVGDGVDIEVGIVGADNT
jgi:hypothetical protein